MIVRQQLLYRTCHDALVEQHGDPVADGIEAVEVVRHHEHAEPQALPQLLDQLVIMGGADGIEAGRRLVEEHEFRVERQCPGEAGALAHAAGKLRGLLAARISRQADQGDLKRGDGAHHLLVQSGVLADRHHDVLGDGQRGKQRAVLELHAGARLQRPFGLAVQAARIDAQHLDLSAPRLVEPDDGAQQHRFAATRTADQSNDLAAEHVEVEMVVDDVVAELCAHPAQLEDDLSPVSMVDDLAAFRGRLGHHTPASRKIMENTESRTITQNIASTTERVVSWPTLSALPLTCNPSKQPMAAMMRPNTGALIMPV